MKTANSSAGTADTAVRAVSGDEILAQLSTGIVHRTSVIEAYPDGSVRAVVNGRQTVLDPNQYEVIA